VVLASPEKLATASPYRIVGLAEISGIVVPAATAAALLQLYRDLGIALMLA
jgi:hypothetical protein